MIINWLSYVDLIVPPLKSRLLDRLWITIALIIALTVVSSSLTNAFSNKGQLLIDGSLGLAQIVIGLFNGTGFLLRKDEQDFLERLKALHHHFYERYVIPAIREFNYQADDSPLFAQMLEAHRKEQEEIRSKALDHLAKRLGVTVEQLETILKK